MQQLTSQLRNGRIGQMTAGLTSTQPPLPGNPQRPKDLQQPGTPEGAAVGAAGGLDQSLTSVLFNGLSGKDLARQTLAICHDADRRLHHYQTETKAWMEQQERFQTEQR